MTANPLPSPLPPRAVVAVFRAPTAEHFVPASEVLWDAGIRCFEYTLTTEGALDALVELRKVLPEALVGVGTVRTVDHLRAASDAGAEFAVSQIFLARAGDRGAGAADRLRPRCADPDRGGHCLERGRPRSQGVPDRATRRGVLPEGVAGADAGCSDHADRWRHSAGRGPVPRRRRRCRGRQQCPAGRRPARRRSGRSLRPGRAADVIGVEVRREQVVRRCRRGNAQ